MRSESPSLSWTGLDVLLIFALWFGAQVICYHLARVADSSAQPTAAAATTSVDKQDNGHPLAQMIAQAKRSPMILLTAFLAAVVVVPILEEFLFRLLLQGWLESTLIQYQVSHASPKAIVAVSLFFAAIHGGNSGAWNVTILTLFFGLTIITNLLILLFGIIHLTQNRRCSLRRYFLGQGTFFPPQFFAVSGYCLCALFLIYGLTMTLGVMFPKTNVSPIPIFFFSLLLGTLYSKTQNLSYSILLHSSLNGISFIVVWLYTLQGVL